MKKDKSIRYFKKFLIRFWKSNDKEKNLILVKIYKKNKEFYYFLDKIKNLNNEEQINFLYQLDNKEVNHWL